jgi:low temperature requirement protein LtrA
LSAPFWVWGALQADPVWRLTGWSLALAIEFLGPFRGFRTPGLGVSQPSDWQISGHHMAERCALFIIITLGEAILVTGATYGGLVQGRDATLALVASFIGSAAMWWIYFDIGAKRGAKMIVQSTQIGLLARNAYTYLHVIIVAGIVVTAVADAIMLNGPTEAVTPPYLAVAIGGPVLFLMGCALFKRVSSSLQYLPLSHGVGQVLLTVLAITAWATEMSVLATGAWATAILILTSVWEWLSLHGGWQRWTPWMEPVLGRFTPPS